MINSKRVEILNIRLEQLTNQRNQLDTRQHRLRLRKSNEQKLMLNSFFKSVNNDLFVAQANSDDRISLKLASDSWGEIVTYNLETRWDRDNDGERIKETNLYHNGSRFKDFSDYILKEAKARMLFMEIAIANDEEIISKWTEIENKYDKLIMSFYPKMRELNDAISSQSKDISELEEEMLFSKLTKGIEFSKSERGRLPELEVRYDWNISRIKALKVLNRTASGKSADLQITQKSQRWDSEKDEYIDTEENTTFEKVRWNKVKDLLRNAQYNNQIV